jgi:hypothetical protein
LLPEILELEVRIVKDFATLLTIPAEMVSFARLTLPLNHEAHCAGRSLWGVRNPRGEQEDVPFANRDISRFTVFDDAHGYVTFDLIEELLALFDVIILPLVWSTNNHDEELTVLPHHPVSYWRLEQVPVFFNPLLQVQGV